MSTPRVNSMTTQVEHQLLARATRDVGAHLVPKWVNSKSPLFSNFVSLQTLFFFEPCMHSEGAQSAWV
jgi:hypothetical protein